MPRLPEGMRRITINLDKTLADWLDGEAAGHISGREVIIDRALRNYRVVVERDRANPRPDRE